MTDWYYEENGMQRGPIKETDLATMFANRFLPLEARVWSAALGSEWTPASKTKFKDSVSGAPPPLPPLLGAQQGQVFTSPSSLPSARPNAKPDVSTHYAAMVALSPLGMLVGDFVAKAAGIDPNADGANLAIQLCWSIAIILACARDVKVLKRGHLNPGNRTIVPFVFLTPLGYFWRRAAILGGGWRYLWIWLACLVVLAIGETAFIMDA
ncbi:DUF4339 domain-containing protein [Mesorhizobium sp.]|uniref:DUF4339 domain-containing protein n=1 Tax=Mesorhizobium sp. TaxID=1871066 RepID=UPI000FE5606B|nr:DUF4339 domain-containing protein [Mesorhizobium sp.]RWI92128.1 MAG: DUF4339 domain-containing protein [Mesorhizobium sp.]